MKTYKVGGLPVKTCVCQNDSIKKFRANFKALLFHPYIYFLILFGTIAFYAGGNNVSGSRPSTFGNRNNMVPAFRRIAAVCTKSIEFVKDLFLNFCRNWIKTSFSGMNMLPTVCSINRICPVFFPVVFIPVIPAKSVSDLGFWSPSMALSAKRQSEGRFFAIKTFWKNFAGSWALTNHASRGQTIRARRVFEELIFRLPRFTFCAPFQAR